MLTRIVFLYAILIILPHCVTPIRIKYSRFYYSSLKNKIDESLSVGKCRVHNLTRTLIGDSDEYALEVQDTSFRIHEYYNEQELTSIKADQTLIGVSSSLCTAREYISYMKKGTKICTSLPSASAPVSAADSRLDSRLGSSAQLQAVLAAKAKKKTKVASALHPSHPRCDQNMIKGYLDCPMINRFRSNIASGMVFQDASARKAGEFSSPFIVTVSPVGGTLRIADFSSHSDVAGSLSRLLSTVPMVASTGMVVIPQCSGVVAYLASCLAEKRSLPYTLLQFKDQYELAQSIDRVRVNPTAVDTGGNKDLNLASLLHEVELVENEMLTEYEEQEAAKLGKKNNVNKNGNQISKQLRSGSGRGRIEMSTKFGIKVVYDNGKSPVSSPLPPRFYPRVFVLTQVDDNQIGQFILEVLPRLVFNLEFLKANPDVKIHFGYAGVIDPRALPYFELLNLSHRLITGLIYAGSVYLPKDGACQDVQYNGIEVLYSRKKLLELVSVSSRSLSGRGGRGGDVAATVTATVTGTATGTATGASAGGRRRIVILQRNPYDPSTKDNVTLNVSKNRDIFRTWTDEFVSAMISELSAVDIFPVSEFEIVIYSDSNRDLVGCIKCQINLFASADVIIGTHGAGLANSIYMPSSLLDKPERSDTIGSGAGSGNGNGTGGKMHMRSKGSGIVVEIIPHFDSRHAPGIGIFPRVSALLGLHHFSYYSGITVERSKKEVLSYPFNVSDFAKNVRNFWRQTRA